MPRSRPAFTLFLALLLATLLGPAVAVAQKSPGIDAARMAAARDLLDATGSAQQLDNMIQIMAQSFKQGAGPSDQGQTVSRDFEAFLAKFKGYRGNMIDDFAALYAERFSIDEMKAITQFYRNGAGAKFIQVMPELMQAGSQIGVKYAQKVMQEVQNGK